ncbi:hypothetical protein BGX26_001213, partial [Mortierella sp. AD094]
MEVHVLTLEGKYLLSRASTTLKGKYYSQGKYYSRASTTLKGKYYSRASTTLKG